MSSAVTGLSSFQCEVAVHRRGVGGEVLVDGVDVRGVYLTFAELGIYIIVDETQHLHV